MTAINKLARAVFLTMLVACATQVPAQPLQGTKQDKQGDQTSSSQQNDAAKQDNHDKQDSQDKQGSSGKQDKKDSTKGNGGSVTIRVLSEQQAPIKDAVAILFFAASKEQRTTGADGRVSFQVRQGPLTLRITADHMEPYQKPLQLSVDQKDSALQVVLSKSK